MQPIVSIIVPCYNYGEYVAQTLQRLTLQTYTEWECIVVNDGSNDDTEKIVKEFADKDKRFVYKYQENQGLSAARNTGIIHSKGKYIQFLDADDLLSNSKLELQVSFMETNPHIAISYSDAYYFLSDNPNRLFRKFAVGRDKNLILTDEEWIPDLQPTETEKTTHYLIKSNVAPVNSMLVQRKVFDDVGLFDTSYKKIEDWNLWFRAALRQHTFSFFKHNDAYALIRVHDDSMSFDNIGMELYSVKLFCDMENMLSSTPYKNGLPRRHIELSCRNIIKQVGFTDTKTLNFLAQQAGWPRIMLWYLKELNAWRKRRRATNK